MIAEGRISHQPEPESDPGASWLGEPDQPDHSPREITSPGWFVRWATRPVIRADVINALGVALFAYEAAYGGWWGRAWAAVFVVGALRIAWKYRRRR